METIISTLKSRLESRGLDPTGNDDFDLLDAVSCESCCQTKSGGNGSCPPPKTLQA